MSDYPEKIGAVIDAARAAMPADAEAAELCADAEAMLAVQAGMSQEQFLIRASESYRIFTAASEAVDAMGEAAFTIN